MSLFDTLLVQPIFNILVFIYGAIPGHDFGIALILFTILVRMLMWPLVKKQLHQTKVMQKIQPELKKIKQNSNGDKQKEAQLMMELYRERGVNPFGSIGLLIVQLPIFIALFAVVRLITEHPDNIVKFTYPLLDKLPQLKAVVTDPTIFHNSLFGVVDLTRQAFGGNKIYWPLLLIAVGAAGLQYLQSKQLLPKVEEGRKLRDILREQSAGKKVDQGEMSAMMTNRMSMLFPILTLGIAAYLSGALVLYLFVTSAVAVIQQGIVLNNDNDELEKRSESAEKRVQTAKEAEIVEPIPSKKKLRKQGKK
jgi:YidC/Oxa1 family membrane protein insertase